MKIVSNTSPNIVSDGMTITEMGVSKKRIQKILGYMRDNVYSDKILAVVREYLCNANDEHTKFKISTPVLTGIRDGECGPEFFVRDFAKGLSDSGIRDIYAMSGESTKDDSDDEIGGFGIGAKSALSYGSKTFFVHSCREGTKTTYCFTLGANKDGQECGSVSDMGRKSTLETGIEVVVPIEQKDLYKFSDKIRDFVSRSPYNIEANILGEIITPIVPTASKKVGDYNFRLLKYELDSGDVLFQMGCNTYKSQSFSGENGAKVKKGRVLVIDIPIGHCSVTLSREGFEQTTKNDKVFAEIRDILNNLIKADLDQFKTKTVFDLVNDSLAAMTVYQGDFFQTYARNLYSRVWSFVENIQIHDYLLPAEQKNGKPICVVIPRNGVRNYWVSKVEYYLKDSSRNLYFISEGDWSIQDAAITDSFELISARKLPYPKTAKANGRFAVYRRTRRRVEMIGKFNALELFNHTSREWSWGFEATTEKEASDFLLEKIKKVNSNMDLERVSVRCSDSRDSSMFTVNSAAFADKLVSLGFIRQGDDQWRKISTKLHEMREKEQKRDKILRSAQKSWVKYGPKTPAAIEKTKHADRVGKFWLAVLSEDSLRGKILKKIGEGSYYSGSNFIVERHELRKIMALK